MNSSYIGKVFDNYRLLQNLGKGGMGLVFKAVNIKLDRLVAIKMIAPGLAVNSNFIKRFQTEAKALAKLENPHIVRIYDLRSFNDQWFIVMEYIEGTTLAEKIRKDGAQSWKDALAIFKQMMLAIDHAHQAGIIHRDIKPSNVIITPEGIVKVMDFGLAKDKENLGVTQTVSTGGTLFYMSPEQVKGLLYTDLRSDVYSLGLTLYEMLVGKTPFSKNHTDFDIRETIVRKNFPSPRELNSQVPEGLDEIVMKAIQKEPDARFQTIKSMQRAISEFEKFGFINSFMLDDAEKIAESLNSVDQTVGTGISEEFGQPVDNTTFSSIQRPSNSANEEKTKSKKFLIILPVIVVILLVIILGIQFEIPKHFAVQKNIKPDNSFSIIGDPDGAHVIVNGDSLGQTPIKNIAYSDELLSIQLTKKDFFSLDTLINSSQIGNNLFSYQLPAAAHVPLRVKPAGASIRIDGSEISLSPDSIITIPVGNHLLGITANGYEDREISFTAKHGINESLESQLTKTSTVQSDSFARLKISTIPSGARVLIDNSNMGTSPYVSQRIAPGRHIVKLTKNGYESYSNSIMVQKDKPGNIEVRLKPYSGSLAVVSKPADSKIFVDGKIMASVQSPHVFGNIRAGKHKVELRRVGYKSYRAEVEIKRNKTSRLEASLQEISAQVEVLVKPWGSIRINDRMIAEDTNIIQRQKLNYGQHALTVSHPTFGVCKKNITITDEKPIRFTIDFNQLFPVVITAFDPQGNPVWGDIIVDGKTTGQQTPREIKLRPGLHKITVKKDGFTLLDGEKEIMLDEDFADTQKFTLRKNF